MSTPAQDFPADTRTLRIGVEDFERGAIVPLRFHLVNHAADAVLHVRLDPGPWLKVAPVEVALAAGERQAVLLVADAAAARAAVRAGAAPVAALTLVWQRLGPAGPAAPATGALYVRLPVAVCPSCEKILDPSLADGVTVPEMCPFCFERLRLCPVCGAPNHWRARRCLADESHVVRDDPEWPCLGGDPTHAGARPLAVGGLSRRWSWPIAAPASGQALAWSAPAAAYGLVAAAATEPAGDAFVHAFEVRRGAPVWEPYPLPDPVYPERGGVALGDGRLYAATVEGVVLALDAIRGTRLWQCALPGRVYAAPTAVPGGPLLVCVATATGGLLCQLDPETGAVLARTELAGMPDTSPACAHGVVYVHDDSGALTAVAQGASSALWTRDGGAPFDAAPVVCDGRVVSATESGVVWCHAADAGGERLWRAEAIGAAITGTPACDASLVYVPAADGLHLLSAATGRAVRRYGSRRPIRSAPVVLSGAVLFGDTDGDIQVAQAGKPLEKLYETGTIGSQIVAAPALSDATLFVCATNGVLVALALT